MLYIASTIDLTTSTSVTRLRQPTGVPTNLMMRSSQPIVEQAQGPIWPCLSHQQLILACKTPSIGTDSTAGGEANRIVKLGGRVVAAQQSTVQVDGHGLCPCYYTYMCTEYSAVRTDFLQVRHVSRPAVQCGAVKCSCFFSWLVASGSVEPSSRLNVHSVVIFLLFFGTQTWHPDAGPAQPRLGKLGCPASGWICLCICQVSGTLVPGQHGNMYHRLKRSAPEARKDGRKREKYINVDCRGSIPSSLLDRSRGGSLSPAGFDPGLARTGQERIFAVVINTKTNTN